MLADRFANIIAYAIGGIRVVPGHIGGIGRETPASISGVRAQEIYAWHLACKAVIEYETDRALWEPTLGVGAEGWIADPRSGRVDNQRPIECGVALKPCTAGTIMVGEGNIR